MEMEDMKKTKRIDIDNDKEPHSEKKNVFYQLFWNFIILITIATFSLIFRFYPAFNSIIECSGDYYRLQKESTIHIGICIGTYCAIILISVLVIELTNIASFYDNNSYTIFKKRIPTRLNTICNVFIGYGYSTLVTYLATNIIKVNFHGVLNTTVCNVINEFRLSRISGHASFVFSAAIYIIIYYQKRFTNVRKSSYIFIKFIQILLFIFAIVVTQSRINDNKHHFDDVILGVIFGVLGAILTLSIINYPKRSTRYSQNNSVLNMTEFT
ncbi:hypothetical protein A3Q56_03127 [Intoshia linei]|uniref:Phosphatidic acid phosphatase type 2/haloperoxidase domain-containing protein n=1 Tax=Intoshia linei TaxID=1819745 RepID=A0A177B4A7_9BILA|nr:hypothetical protein A3Q56_03127 [Intoshia linei]